MGDTRKDNDPHDSKVATQASRSSPGQDPQQALAMSTLRPPLIARNDRLERRGPFGNQITKAIRAKMKKTAPGAHM